MNDLITMSIQGGRYLEAEKQIGDIVLNNPSDEAYFMLGTTKSNLLLDKGRSYLEVQFCFNKYLELTEDKSEGEKNIMAFCVGLYSQLSELEKNLFQQRKKEARNVALGALVTFAASKVIDNSSKSFGVISGFVGASFGIGMSMEGLSNIGSVSDMITYVSRIKVEMIEYLKNTIVNEKDLLETEVLTLSEKYGSVASTDSSIDTSLLESLGTYFIQPAQAIAMTKDAPVVNFTVKLWKTKGAFSYSQWEIPNDQSVIGGFSSGQTNEVMEFLFTDKGVWNCVPSPKFMSYKDVKFKKGFTDALVWNGHFLPHGTFKKMENAESIAKTLNEFVSQMKS